jgi:hypothetical protein
VSAGLELIAEPTPSEAPIAWRCSWIRTTGYLPFHPIQPKPETMDCATREEADKAKAHLREMWPGIVITVTPVYPKARKMTKKALRQALDAAGWPLQMRVPR